MSLTKEAVYAFVQEELNSRVVTIQSSLRSHKEGLLSESKSSAGDKHNTSRAMMHLEEEKLNKQLAQFGQLKKVLHSVNPSKVDQDVTLGSLIETNKGWLFLAVPLGNLTVMNMDLMAVSLASPIGQALKGKKSGDEVKFQGTVWKLISVK